MSWYLATIKKYATFSGRARRKEYWMFALFNFIFSIVAMGLDIALASASQEGSLRIFSALYSLGVLLPSLAVLVRRLHDIGKSGWWIFISLVPFIGPIWLLVLTLSDSQPGENQYGLNPKTSVANMQPVSIVQ